MINIVIALRCEAKSLIHHFKLKDETHRGNFRVYSNDSGDNNSIRLVISGVGRVAAAAATAYLEDTGKHKTDAAWLNIGVAGHPSKSVGDVLMAHTLSDGASGHRVYPQWVFDPPCATECLLTADQPMTDLPANTMVDMEAFGFYSTAIRFAPSERIHCLKVISDNGASLKEGLSSKQVETLIRGAMGPINAVVAALGGLVGHA